MLIKGRDARVNRLIDIVTFVSLTRLIFFRILLSCCPQRLNRDLM